MTDLDLDVRDSLERIFPAPVVLGDWDAVLDRAGARERSRARSLRRWPVAAVAAAVLVGALLVAPFGVGARLLDLIQGGAPVPPVVAGHAWSPDGRQLAFLRLGDARHPRHRPEFRRYEVHVVNADGSDERVLARDSISWSPPAWSPGGPKLAYVNVRRSRNGRVVALEIYVVNADGSGRRRLATGVKPTWSPDGSRLAFLTVGGAEVIHVVNADGSARRRLVRGWAPSWSPDGRQLAFLRGDASSTGIYVVDADGAGERRLIGDLGLASFVAWSPDGARIAFTSRRDRDWELRVVNADGSAERTLAGASGWGPSWSLDGQQIAFTSRRDGNWDVYVIGADGSGLRRLTRHPAEDGSPLWSPDGRGIAFLSSRGGTHAIWFMNADGSGQRRLTRRGP